MRMIKFEKKAPVMVWALLMGGMMTLASGCDVHQFPEQKEEPEMPEDPNDPEDPTPPDEPDPELSKDVTLDLKYHTDMYLWHHYYDPKIGEVVEANPEANVDGNHPGTTDIYTGERISGVKHAVVKIYKRGNTTNHVVMQEVIHDLVQGYDVSMPVKIEPGEYDVVVWSDLRENLNDNLFYDYSNFDNIKIDYDLYSANNDYRDTFRGRQTIKVAENGEVFSVDLYRPMAKYEFVTTDLSEFLDKETERRNLSTRATMDDYIVRIYYSGYHPSAYSATEDILRDATTGVSFRTEVTVTGESEASLGFDYVFINGDTSKAGVQATIVVYDLQGTAVASSSQITVPLRRDHHTILRGAFLTMNGSGGVGIDPSYNGDHNVTFQ